MKRLSAEGGFTMVELLVATVLMAIVMVGVVNVFVSGSRAGATSNGRLAAQQNVRLATDRLEFEARCSSAATLVSGGAGVILTLPTQCSHATGTVSWCVVSGVLERFTTSGCSGTGQSFISGVTTTTPFSLPTTPTGDLPTIALTITVSTFTGTRATLSDVLTMRNAAPAS